MIVIVMVFLGAGLFFLTVSTVGLIRLPDFLSRAHAVGKSETLGAMLVLIALAIYNGWALVSFKIFLIVFLVAVTNPTGVHAITRAAVRKRQAFWVREDDDQAHPTVPRAEEGS